MNLNRRGFLISTGAAITAVTLPFLARAADKLKIGMIGSGRVGSALGNALVLAGHEVMFSSRHLEADQLLAERIGTVDRFQGQEAPVVIYSMTSSSPDDAPRGMEFLYNRNRFNVATSRALGLCVLVGSPALFEPECRTPKQIKMANGFCRYLELAIHLPGG